MTVKAKAGPEGRLFGSVTVTDIAAAVAAQTRVELDRKVIQLHDHIKAVGTYQVPVKLHNDVQFAVNVEVVAG